ncbi:hypothetical protein OG455_11035 [Kitasatospora sp. NBC_01287]|uniref:hypothetical protein n=1 Tax=Kitasatospora sp. NBC_01287 TaxID=2903573 RepID=UPI002258CBAD|nr:hypothetical protein [Kitasatospora sp. NBC_01287]MCX4746048.1 hypothetical protein [Kitasatospora sp. NBC_01287]
MSTQLLLVTQVAVEKQSAEQAVKAWQQLNIDAGATAQLYRSLDRDTLLELRALKGLAELPALRNEWAALWDTLAPFLAGDFRRQLQEFVEAPKPTELELPDTTYVQLRRVEVKPPVIADYRAWRERTIFETVRAADESEIFLAYHSLMSTEPGVLFVAGFNGSPEVHNAVFRTPEYEAILVQARDNYIVTHTGGDAGLFLETFARVEA